MIEKVCGRCKVKLPATEDNFYVNNNYNDGLSNCCKTCRKEYGREWKKKNKKRHSELSVKYSQTEKGKEKIKIYRAKNKEMIYESHKKWREKNSDYTSQSQKKWRKKNSNYTRQYKNKIKSIKQKLPCTLTSKQWEVIKADFDNKCCYCGEEKPLEQEHFMPLKNGGEYTKDNIIPSCKSCNSSKRAEDFFKWYPRNKNYSKKRENKIIQYLNYTKENTQQLNIF